MNGLSPGLSSAVVLGAMITPALLISAVGMLVLSTSHRLARTVDRVRQLVDQAVHLRDKPPQVLSKNSAAWQSTMSEQIDMIVERMLLLRSAMVCLYLAMFLLVATSIAVGIDAVFRGAGFWLPVGTGLSGAVVFLLGILLLVKEAIAAVQGSLKEVDYFHRVLGESAGPQPNKE